MPVDINNNFNSAEERVQYALGTMQAYSIGVESKDGSYSYSVANYPGIIAQNPTEALKKLLEHLEHSSRIISGHCTLRVNLCE